VFEMGSLAVKKKEVIVNMKLKSIMKCIIGARELKTFIVCRRT
jgi:hypothetical protein